MKKLFLALLVTILALSVTTVFAAKPVQEIFHLTRSGQVSCGWDCDRDDPVIGLDEAWGWAAEGKIKSGQVFGHGYLTGGSGRVAFASLQWKGKGNAEVTISNAGESVTYGMDDMYRIQGYRKIDACLNYYPDGATTVTITGDVKNLGAWGSDWMWWIGSPAFDCPPR